MINKESAYRKVKEDFVLKHNDIYPIFGKSRIAIMEETADSYIFSFIDPFGLTDNVVFEEVLIMDKETGAYKEEDYLKLMFEDSYKNRTKIDISKFEKDGN